MLREAKQTLTGDKLHFTVSAGPGYRKRPLTGIGNWKRLTCHLVKSSLLPLPSWLQQGLSSLALALLGSFCISVSGGPMHQELASHHLFCVQGAFAHCRTPYPLALLTRQGEKQNRLPATGGGAQEVKRLGSVNAWPSQDFKSKCSAPSASLISFSCVYLGPSHGPCLIINL